MSEIRVDNITDEAGTGAPGFPNGITATGAALTDPEITGGIYLGGTGSANFLDDYEEGTWTPTFNNSDGCFSGITGIDQIAHAQYVKIGRFVHLSCVLSLNGSISNSEGVIRFNNIPFSFDLDGVLESNRNFALGIAQIYDNHGGEDSEIASVGINRSTEIIVYRGTVNGTDSFRSLHFSLNYYTNS